MLMTHALILTKPSDLTNIGLLSKFNSFHPNIQFTIDEFNNNDIHFLDIQIHYSGTSVYRKPTHTGQCQCYRPTITQNTTFCWCKYRFYKASKKYKIQACCFVT